jgi:hypothetical protein
MFLVLFCYTLCAALCDGAVLVLRAVLFAVAFLAFGGTFSTPHIAPIFTKVSDYG